MMTYTPFEREMLKEQKRTNDLLELLIMAHQPMKVMTGAGTDLSAEALQQIEARSNELGRQHAEAVKGMTMPIEQALAHAGILPMGRRPGSGQPETPEQRAERFAARAKEVGLPEDQVAEVSGRVQLNLDTLVQQSPEDPFDEPAPPAKKAPAKRAAKAAQ